MDLLRIPLVGTLLTKRHARTLLQIPVFIISAAMIFHGLFGPQLAPRNLATTVTWVHFRGALVLVLLLAGNFFCLACPFMLVRNLARKFFRPVRNWPRRLRNKWFSLALFVTMLFLYEWLDLWASPWWTAWLIVAYFAGALLIDAVFKHATFCKFVCPIGQFNFVASTASPLEVTVRDMAVCTHCKTKDCIRGVREQAAPLVVIQRGCELALFQPRKTGNVDCTFCLDCVQACPHDNVGIISRVPAGELTTDPMRSGLGIFSKRKDLAGRSRRPIVAVAVRYSYVLAPLGFGIWLAHYGFHFLTGLYTLVPVTQAALAELGWAVMGQPRWGVPGIAPIVVQVIEFGFVFLGLLGSLLLSYSITAAEKVDHPSRIFVLWAAVAVIVTLGALWLMSQPMEMRAVTLS